MNKLNNAEVALDLCRAVFLQHRQEIAADALRGVELFDVNAARLALGLLRGTAVRGKVANDAKQFAINALEEALRGPISFGDA